MDETAAEAYMRVARCSRLSSSLFLDHKVPAEYVAEVMDALRARSAAITTMETIAFFNAGVSVPYAIECYRLGLGSKRALELWKDGVAIEYVQTLYGV